MKKIAITGGIGCGKSYVSEIISKLTGKKVLSMDEIAKEMLIWDSNKFVNEFGEIFYTIN
jgi:dephospho-CoA kinase